MKKLYSRRMKWAEYEYKLTNENLIPLLKDWNINLKNKKLIDVGCGEGGCSVAFAEQDCHCIGIDINEDLIDRAIKFAKMKNVNVTFLEHDICSSEPIKEHDFDIAIFRDTIEHVNHPESALTNIRRLLKEGGLLYVSFPPIYSPFGGHQHHSKSIVRFVPYIHLLPNFIFLQLLLNKDSMWYKKFIETVKKNKISLSSFEKTAKKLKFDIYKKELYLTRPVFKVRYGIPAIKLGILSRIPLVKEFITTGCTYLLVK